MSSIPLPALDIKPPADPTEGIQKGMMLRNMMQEQQLRGQQIQAGQLENQQRMQSVKDQQTLLGLYQKHNGDLDKVVADAPGAGVSPAAMQQLQLHAMDVKAKTQDLVAKQGTEAARQADLMLGAHDAVDKAPAEQKPTVYQNQILGLRAQGVDISQFPTTYPGDEQFKNIGIAARAHSKMVEDALKSAEQAKNTAQAGEADAETSKIQSETAFRNKYGIASGVPVDVLEMADYLEKHPGKGPADYAGWKASLAPVARFNVETSGGGAPGTPAAQVAQKFGMNQTAFDQAAEKYWTTGQLPPLGRGISGVALNRALMNRAGELHPDGSLAGNEAAFKANAESLKKLQTNFDQVTAFENTAGKNLGVFLKTAKNAIDSGSPWINTPLRSLASGMLGSEDQTAVNVARTTALTEIAKVLNSSNASGVLSDSARHEVEQLSGPGATMKQIYQAADILTQDMSNRHQSYQDQINDIQRRIPGGPSSGQDNNGQQNAPVGTGKVNKKGYAIF
jgi:hypothetical protein